MPKFAKGELVILNSSLREIAYIHSCTVGQEYSLCKPGWCGVKHEEMLVDERYLEPLDPYMGLSKFDVGDQVIYSDEKYEVTEIKVYNNRFRYSLGCEDAYLDDIDPVWRNVSEQFLKSAEEVDMKPFKKGDHVIITRMDDKWEGAYGTVVRVYNETLSVELDQETVSRWVYKFDEVEKIETEFKPGDRVIDRKGTHKERVGTVKKERDDKGWYLVDFDDRGSWYAHENSLTLILPEPENIKSKLIHRIELENGVITATKRGDEYRVSVDISIGRDDQRVEHNVTYTNESLREAANVMNRHFKHISNRTHEMANVFESEEIFGPYELPF